MTSKGSFDNPFDDYSEGNLNVKQILDDLHSTISTRFREKIRHFKTEKLNYLTTTLKQEILHDGTIYTGSAGLALYYLISAIDKNASNLEQLQNALQYINIDKLKGRRISFLCGDAGPLAIATVISYKLGTRRPSSLPDYKVIADRLLNLISLLNDSPDELLYGKVGYLYALLFVNKYVSGKNVIPADHIEKVIASILKSGKQFSLQTKSPSPLLWQWHEKIYLGAAHGMAGIIYILLLAREYLDVKDIRSYIKPSLDWLLSQRFSSWNFPSSLGSSSGDRLVQWCHGAPGFVPLCILANQVLNDEKYLKMAVQCGDVVWQRGLSAKGYSICHGVSGNAYAFLQLYQATKKPMYLYRACCFMEWCAVERAGTELQRPDRPASLFEGLLGRIYLADDILHPFDAKFPAMGL